MSLITWNDAVVSGAQQRTGANSVQSDPTTSSRRAIPIRGAGKLRRFRVSVASNTRPAATDVQVLLDGGATAMLITIPAATGGEWSYTVTEPAVPAGDHTVIFLTNAIGAGGQMRFTASVEFLPS